MNTVAATTASPDPRGPLLSLEAVVVAFGGLQALGGVDLEVRAGDRLALLGPNGAGKTTLFNVIAGDIKPASGRVTIKGIDCTELPARFRPRLGVARTYQKTRLFRGLSVEDNLYLAQTGRTGRHLSLVRSGTDAALRHKARRIAETWLGVAAATTAGDLSHGQQRQLEIGMALVTEPEFVMLDEPASGLSHGERDRLVEMLLGLEDDITLLLIEHDMDVALRAAQRVMVMNDGVVVAGGTPEEIRHDPLVHEIYLGSEAGP